MTTDRDKYTLQDISEEVMALLDSLDIEFSSVWEDSSGDLILCLEEGDDGQVIDIVFRQYPRDFYETLTEEERTALDEVL